MDAALADSLIKQAQEIIDALSAGGSRHGWFTAVSHQTNGRVQLRFTGDSATTYFVEASTNLVDWETIGEAVDLGDGTFDFEDKDAATMPNRFYRIVSP
jgi:hypothetical protein